MLQYDDPGHDEDSDDNDDCFYRGGGARVGMVETRGMVPTCKNIRLKISFKICQSLADGANL